MNFSISPGQKKTLTVIFTDNATPPVQHPLSAVPSATDTTNVATVAPVGTQTATDPQYAWDVTCPATAVIGSQLAIDVKGVNPDGTPDEQTYSVDVIALDDTLQQATFV
jgi:hypothetical protein